MSDTEIDTLCDRCGKRLTLDEAIDYDGATVCDDCACKLGDEEVTDE